MKSIDKVNLASANSIIDPYLAYARTQPWFATDDIYLKFSNAHGKRRLVDTVLLPEQDCRCCYCQKRFSPSNDRDASVEHMIPRSTAYGADFNDYFSIGYPGLMTSSVCHTQDYKNGNSVPGQYPHHVAYHNFAIACQNCNSRRGNKVIGFPFLLPAPQQDIVYNRKTGKVDWFGDPRLFDGSAESELMVNAVELNIPFLKATRAVWFYGKDHPNASYSTPDTVHDQGERKQLIRDALGSALDADPQMSIQDIEAFLSLEVDANWDKVLKYDFFKSI